ncbi:MAG: PfkB family carbohydrate kinase [Clostridia bacterium]|nr:PfkB family carbohydrate kinase [Clostridia bacterium]
MKFAVLSLNPGIDRVLYLTDPITTGGLNRTARSVTSQGSKGANVAIMLSRLGCKVEYYAFTGGVYGKICDSFTDCEENITPFYVSASCGVRVNTKVIDSDGCCTELNERGGPFSENEFRTLSERFLSSDADVFCLCGSIPQGVEKSVYNLLISRLKAVGKITVLDCDGDALIQGIKAKPDYIKPNLYELSVFLKSTGLCETFSSDKIHDKENIRAACGKITDTYGTGVLCTLGDNGALAVTEKESYFCSPAKVKLRGFSGAGDCFLAGFVYAKYSLGLGTDKALAAASACGGAKVELEGSFIPSYDSVNEILSLLDPQKL